MLQSPDSKGKKISSLDIQFEERRLTLNEIHTNLQYNPGHL